MKTAVLLIAHGSRRPEANADLEHLAARLRERGSFDFVQTSYLELAQPDILTGGDLCITAGVERVVLLPYFLSPGVHVREDLCDAREELQRRYPNISFLLAGHLGRHPKLLEIVEERIAESFSQPDSTPIIPSSAG